MGFNSGFKGLIRYCLANNCCFVVTEQFETVLQATLCLRIKRKPFLHDAVTLQNDVEDDLRKLGVKRWRTKALEREEWASNIKEAKAVLKGP